MSHRGLLGFPRRRKEGREEEVGWLLASTPVSAPRESVRREKERKERRKRLVDQRETLILFLRETFDGGGRSPSK